MAGEKIATGNIFRCNSFKREGEVFMETRKENVNYVGSAKEIVERWLERNGWCLSDFPIFLEKVGVKTPIEIVGTDRKMLECRRDGEDECLLGLHVKEDAELPCDQIYVSRKGVSTYYNVSKCGTNPEIWCDTTYKHVGKTALKTSYRPTFWRRKLNLGDDKALNMLMSFPEDENFGYEKADEIEEYLLGITHVNPDEICKEIIKILGFSEEDVKSSTIEMSYEDSKENKKIADILLKEGEWQKYAVLEKEEVFQVSKTGEKKYISPDGITIEGNAKKIELHIEAANEDEILKKDLRSIIFRVKEKWQQIKNECWPK